MATDLQTPNEQQSTTALVSGIVADAQELFKQQITLLQVEVEKDLRDTSQALIALVIGMATTLVGASMLAFMVVYLLAHLFPATPIWVFYGIVGGIVAAVGGFLVSGALYAFSQINPLPEKSAQALKENVGWETNQPR
jgi:hypothetical protein